MKMDVHGFFTSKSIKDIENNKLIRWNIWLEKIDIEFDYRAGNNNVFIDFLVREFQVPIKIVKMVASKL